MDTPKQLLDKYGLMSVGRENEKLLIQAGTMFYKEWGLGDDPVIANALAKASQGQQINEILKGYQEKLNQYNSLSDERKKKIKEPKLPEELKKQIEQNQHTIQDFRVLVGASQMYDGKFNEIYFGKLTAKQALEYAGTNKEGKRTIKIPSELRKKIVAINDKPASKSSKDIQSAIALLKQNKVSRELYDKVMKNWIEEGLESLVQSN